ncbi:rhodanese-like domain-containing protein [Vagococcus vulneris]|uniref:Rhodanese domain-containing protein n=1 Tax=Vagococcus vulneris TaxID=1977869 RepID=A0A429ZY91_9ENTE|nr:rhodanese-like domain-containing protein [Vagococcus vulneris]RST98922.1 hypothetical protein CBF37_06005 [Vagococcus vulneris]
MNNIKSENFRQKLDNEKLRIIDVREVHEFKKGHIKMAENIPLSILANQLEKVSHDETYYLICQGGGRSAHAAEFLNSKGYQVVNVLGGMNAWQGFIDKSDEN